MKNNLLNDFYDICEICNDDLNIVIEVIAFHHTPEEKLSRVRSDIMEYTEQTRLEKYAKTFDKVLSLPSVYLKCFIAVKRGKINSEVIKVKRAVIEPIKEHYNTPSLFEGME